MFLTNLRDLRILVDDRQKSFFGNGGTEAPNDWQLIAAVGASVLIIQIPPSNVESIAFDGYRVAFGTVGMLPLMAGNISNVDVS